MPIPKACKRLAEVDFPIARVSEHAVREKSIRYGHPSTLHLWWARRPLAACRAMLLALLLPDPADPYCPPEFKEMARRLLPGLLGAPQRWSSLVADDKGLRKVLLDFIADFANWDHAADPTYLALSRQLVQAAHPDETPLVVDPFAGGGSIPLEALRLGCEAFASDLNPVAGLILKVMLEDIPRYGPGLADQLRRVGAEIKQAAEEELAEFYPPDPDGARPIAYLWARTVRCEAPNCGAEIPLMRSCWLSKKESRKRALRYWVERPQDEPPRVEFEIFEPRSDRDVPSGTVNRARATCLCCGVVLSPERVRAQLVEQCGGADVIFDAQGQRVGGARLLVVVTLKPGEQGRRYRLPTTTDYRSVWRVQQRLTEVAAHLLPNGLKPVPDEPTPAGGGSGASRAFSVQRYGMTQWGDLFTARQKLALVTLRNAIASISSDNIILGEISGLALSRFADISNAFCQWENTKTQVRHLFTRQALPMLWDFAEADFLGEQAGDYTVTLGTMAQVIEVLPKDQTGQVELADAAESPLPDESVSVWFTDPPYYDAIPYSDLSDFFFVWLKRILPNNPLLHDPFDQHNPLTPKTREAVQDEVKRVNDRPKDRTFFEEKMGQAFAEGRRVLREDGVGCVVFAHKTTEGWEALLSGMIQGGWTITGSWPIATESVTRLRARESAALATSVHLVCRPRPEDAPIGDWADVLRGLPGRVADWIELLQGEGIRGADLIFACIGPALEIFSRYRWVETPEGREVKLPEYLEKVWEAVGRAALEQILGTEEARARNGAAGVLEEDARLTALFLWTLQSSGEPAANTVAAEEDEEPASEDDEGAAPRRKTGGYSLVFDVARRFAQPLGIHLPDWEGRVIETSKGVVRLLPVAERAEQLFGEEGAQAVASEIERSPAGAVQLRLFAETEQADIPRIRGRGRSTAAISDESLRTRHEATTLDRVHAAMLLQKSGRANALRALLKAEQERSPDFVRLANALSALYPRESEEKRLLDAMLLAIPK